MTQTTAAVMASELVKRYGTGDTRVTALAGVDVHLARQEFTAIMGPSGSGKSTLMHCLAGLDQADEGEVWIGEARLSGPRTRSQASVRSARRWFSATAAALASPQMATLIFLTRPSIRWSASIWVISRQVFDHLAFLTPNCL